MVLLLCSYRVLKIILLTWAALQGEVIYDVTIGIEDVESRLESDVANNCLSLAQIILA